MYESCAADLLDERADRRLDKGDKRACFLHRDAAGAAEEFGEDPRCALVRKCQVIGVGVNLILVRDVPLVAKRVHCPRDPRRADAETIGKCGLLSLLVEVVIFLASSTVRSVGTPKILTIALSRIGTGIISESAEEEVVTGSSEASDRSCATVLDLAFLTRACVLASDFLEGAPFLP